LNGYLITAHSTFDTLDIHMGHDANIDEFLRGWEQYNDHEFLLKKAEKLYSMKERLPQGLLFWEWVKIHNALENASLDEGEFIDIRSHKVVDVMSENEKYCLAGSFCGPHSLEPIIKWCAKMELESYDAF